MLNRILIVDDEKNIRLTIKRSLGTEQFEIAEAVSGEEAMTLLQHNSYELVLLDLKLPGISGLDVLRELKDQNRTEKVVIISAHGTIETAVESMKLGASDFLEKPFTPDDIRQIVVKHIEQLE